jgi:hypothetical protein
MSFVKFCDLLKQMELNLGEDLPVMPLLYRLALDRPYKPLRLLLTLYVTFRFLLSSLFQFSKLRKVCLGFLHLTFHIGLRSPSNLLAGSQTFFLSLGNISIKRRRVFSNLSLRS